MWCCCSSKSRDLVTRWMTNVNSSPSLKAGAQCPSREGEKSPHSPPFSSLQAFSRLDETQLHQGGQACFTQPLIQIFSPRKAFTCTPETVLDQMWGYPQSPVRLRQSLAITGGLDQAGGGYMMVSLTCMTPWFGWLERRPNTD